MNFELNSKTCPVYFFGEVWAVECLVYTLEETVLGWYSTVWCFARTYVAVWARDRSNNAVCHVWPQRTHRDITCNSSPPGQNRRHFAYDIVKNIFVNEKFWLIPDGPIGNMSALVQAMVWRRTGDKPLPEPRLTWFTDAYMRHSGRRVNSLAPGGCGVNFESYIFKRTLWS